MKHMKMPELSMNVPPLAVEKMPTVYARPKFPDPTEIMTHAMSGEAAFAALREAVNELTGCAPKDHDVLIHAFNIAVHEVRFLKPHALLFRGMDADGRVTFAVCHFSQLVAHIVYAPKQGEKRIITGFSQGQ
jgi:hypothetical protein